MQLARADARRPRRGRRGRRVRPLASCTVREPGRLLAGLPAEQTCWMSHRDTVFEAPPGFTALASSTASPVAAFEAVERGDLRDPVPPRGRPHARTASTILDDVPARHLRLRHARGRAASIVDEQIARIRAQVGDGKVICGLSRRRRLVGRGAARAPRDRRPADVRVRRPRPDAQERGRAGHRRVPRPLQGPARRRRRRGALPRRGCAGVTEPEAKRKVIGAEFIRVFEEEAAKLGDAKFLVQGTLYSDVIESGGGTGAATIKSHHNVGGLPDDLEFELVEPLRALFKDEVRAVGAELGLPERLVWRQPFPGPGLAIRIVGGEATQGAPRPPARRRLHPPGRDPQGRPLPRAVAVLLRAAGHPHGRRAGRRAHLRQRRRDPRGHVATTR